MRFKYLAIPGLLLSASFALPAGVSAEPPIRPGQAGEKILSATPQKDPLQIRIPTADTKSKDAGRKKKPARKAQSGGTIVRSVLGLAFVLCLILAGTAWLRKHHPQANKTLPHEAVQILGQRSVGGRQMIQLIRCGSRILILGSTSQGLTTLSEVTDPVEVDFLAGLCRQEQSHSVTSAFAQLFQNYRETKGETEQTGHPLRSIRKKLGWSRPAAEEAVQPPEPPSPTPEVSLKEKLGRLSPSVESVSPGSSAKEERYG